jgi:hypothetical protein
LAELVSDLVDSDLHGMSSYGDCAVPYAVRRGFGYGTRHTPGASRDYSDRCGDR